MRGQLHVANLYLRRDECHDLNHLLRGEATVLIFGELSLAEVAEQREKLRRVDTRADQTREPVHKYGQDVTDFKRLGVVQVLQQVSRSNADQALALAKKVYIDKFSHINVNLLNLSLIILSSSFLLLPLFHLDVVLFRISTAVFQNGLDECEKALSIATTAAKLHDSPGDGMPLGRRSLGGLQSQCRQCEAEEGTLIADEVHKPDQCLEDLTSAARAINELPPIIRSLERQLGAILQHSLELELHIVAEGDNVLSLTAPWVLGPLRGVIR